MKEYQPLPYRFRSQAGCLLYYTNDFDGVEVDRQGKMLSFEGPDQIRTYLGRKRLKAERPRWDLESVEQWLKSSGPVDCPLLYESWNLFGDLARSVGEEFLGYADEAQCVQEELFWGCNFPGMGHYDPSFTDSDLEVLRAVLAQGIELLENHLRSLEPSQV